MPSTPQVPQAAIGAKAVGAKAVGATPGAKSVQTITLVVPTRDTLVEVRTRAEVDAEAQAQVGGLVVGPLYCRRLEETVGLGATRTVEDFVLAVERLGRIAIGDVRLPFTPGQLAELKHRAEKRGRSVEQEMQAVVSRIEDELFHRGA